MILLVNASQILEKGDPKNFIPPEGIDRIADTLRGWKEEEKLSRIFDRTRPCGRFWGRLGHERVFADNGNRSVSRKLAGRGNW